MIRATAYSDDHCVTVDFDATPWFFQATEQEIRNLAECGWGGDYAADEVALFMASLGDCPERLTFMFSYIEARSSIADPCGFECHVNEEDARKWLKDNIPPLAFIACEVQ